MGPRFFEGDSPFLQEALEATPSEATQARVTAALARVARVLPRESRPHVERALVRHLADRGATEAGEMASAVESLRRRIGESGDADPMHVVEHELSGCPAGACPAGACRCQHACRHGEREDPEDELTLGDAMESSAEENECDEGFAAGETAQMTGTEPHAWSERGEAMERDAPALDETVDELFAARHDEVHDFESSLGDDALDANDEMSDLESPFRDETTDLEDETTDLEDETTDLESPSRHPTESSEPMYETMDHEAALDGEISDFESPFADEARDPSDLPSDEEDVADASSHREPPARDRSEPRVHDARAELALLNELYAPIDVAELEMESEASSDDAGVEMESEAPAGADIRASLDAIKIVRSTIVTQRQAPNPFDLNAIASRNSPAQRRVFQALQRTWIKLRAADKAIAKAKKPSKKLTDQRASLVRQRDQQAAALEAWVRTHALDHSRRRSQLVETITKLERKLTKLEGQAREAAQAELAGKKLGLRVLEAALQTSARVYRALQDAPQTYYELSVPTGTGAATIRLHDHVIAFATDTRGGFAGGATTDSRAAVAAALGRSGISADKQAMLRVLSSLEGHFSTVNTWDRAVVTFGFIQWTTDEAGDGTLCKLMAALRSASPAAYRRCFQRYGIDLAGRRLRVTRPDGTTLVGTDAARFVQTSVKHVAALSAAGTDLDMQAAQIRFAAESKIDAMLARTVSAGGKSARLADLLTSEYAVAVMLDRATGTGEGGTRSAAQRGFAAFVAQSPSADLRTSAARAAAGARVLAAIEALDKDRAAQYAALCRERGSYAS
jgi:hypothetical protein